MKVTIPVGTTATVVLPDEGTIRTAGQATTTPSTTSGCPVGAGSHVLEFTTT